MGIFCNKVSADRNLDIHSLFHAQRVRSGFLGWFLYDDYYYDDDDDWATLARRPREDQIAIQQLLVFTWWLCLIHFTPPRLFGLNLCYHMKTNVWSICWSILWYFFSACDCILEKGNLIVRTIKSGPVCLLEKGWYPEHLVCPQYQQQLIVWLYQFVGWLKEKKSLVIERRQSFSSQQQTRFHSQSMTTAIGINSWEIMRAKGFYFVNTPK